MILSFYNQLHSKSITVAIKIFVKLTYVCYSNKPFPDCQNSSLFWEVRRRWKPRLIKSLPYLWHEVVLLLAKVKGLSYWMCMVFTELCLYIFWIKTNLSIRWHILDGLIQLHFYSANFDSMYSDSTNFDSMYFDSIYSFFAAEQSCSLGIGRSRTNNLWARRKLQQWNQFVDLLYLFYLELNWNLGIMSSVGTEGTPPVRNGC